MIPENYKPISELFDILKRLELTQKDRLDLLYYISKFNVNPDWNVLDPDSSKFITNRPFGEQFNKNVKSIYSKLEINNIKQNDKILIKTFENSIRPSNILIYNTNGTWFLYEYSETLNNEVSLPTTGPVTKAKFIEEDNKLYIVFTRLFNYGIKDTLLVGDGELKLINEKYISKNIARVNDVILKGINNKMISDGAIALGENNTIGLKAYPFIYIDKVNKQIYLSNQNVELIDTKPSADLSFQCPYTINDIFSIHLGTNYYNCGKIEFIYGNIITVDYLPEDLPTYDEEKRYFFYVIEKPDKGIIDIGKNSFVTGLNNKVYNEASYSEGKENKSIGKYSHTEGKENEAHYCSHAEGSNNIAMGNTSHAEGTDNKALNSNSHVEGRYTVAIGYAAHAEGYGESLENPNLAQGNYSHVEGEKNKAFDIASHVEGMINEVRGKAAHVEGRENQTNNDYAHAEGYLTKANGVGSHTEGVGTQTKNNGEHAEGRFNKSNSYAPSEGSNPKNTIHSIGIGTSDNNRKNACEIMQDGKYFIINLGNYDGTNPNSSVDLVTYIKNLEKRIEILEQNN